MDQTSQAAAIAVVLGASGGVIGMLTVFARASRTSTVTRSRRPQPVAAASESVVVSDIVEQPHPGAEGVIVKQRGISTSV